jgi:hypothetical protein
MRLSRIIYCLWQQPEGHSGQCGGHMQGCVQALAQSAARSNIANMWNDFIVKKMLWACLCEMAGVGRFPVMLVIFSERIIGSNRIFDGCPGLAQIKANKGRVGDQGAERAVETAGRAVILLIFGARCLLGMANRMHRGSWIRGCSAAIPLGYRANGR